MDQYQPNQLTSWDSLGCSEEEKAWVQISPAPTGGPGSPGQPPALDAMCQGRPAEQSSAPTASAAVLPDQVPQHLGVAPLVNPTTVPHPTATWGLGAVNLVKPKGSGLYCCEAVRAWMCLNLRLSHAQAWSIFFTIKHHSQDLDLCEGNEGKCASRISTHLLLEMHVAGDLR